jgi:excisionase family DNA binding protein
MSPLLTVAQAADLLAVSRPTIYRLVRSAGLPAVRPSGDLRFREEDIAQWLEDRRVVK